MLSFHGTVTQTGVDTATYVEIVTGVLPSGRTGLQFIALEAYSGNGYQAAAADAKIEIYANTTGTWLTPFDADEIAKISWSVQNTGGVAVAMVFDQYKRYELFEPRVTVQPKIYIMLSSVGSGLTNVVSYRLWYEEVKLTELEVMRLLVGGA